MRIGGKPSRQGILGAIATNKSSHRRAGRLDTSVDGAADLCSDCLWRCENFDTLRSITGLSPAMDR